MKEYITEVGDTVETTGTPDEVALEADKDLGCLVYITKHDLEEMLALLEGEG